MRKITQRLIKMSASDLDEGEEILVGVRVNLKGTAIGFGFSSLGSVIGMEVGNQIMEDGQEQVKDAQIPFKQQMAFGLTQKRLIIWSRSSFSGRPKDIIGEMNRSDIQSIRCEEGGMTGDVFVMTLTNGKSVEFEAVKIDKGEEFAGLFGQ
ncbi:MAG: hypothetical protein QNK23_11350 [Crocinitomicaceae bacterium]|nr:hypothetical protein [Crocinitomicaceae bacterium]